MSVTEVSSTPLVSMAETQRESGPLVHMSAGAMAGMLEHTVMFPFDVVKTRLQALRPEGSAKYLSTHHALQTMYREEGMASFFKGIRAVAAGAGPAHALYFGVYEKSKQMFGANEPGHQHRATALAALCATVSHDAFMNPVEVVKQRMQVKGSPFHGIRHCAKHIFVNEGIRAFYRSFSTQLIMNIPYQTTHLVTYEFLRETFRSGETYDPRTHLLAGAGAGALASAVTTPFDVAKTLLNTQEACPGARASQGKAPIVGTIMAVRTINRLAGWRGFMKGMSARVLFTTPACAISWSVYEFFKHYLGIAVEDPEFEM